MIAENSSAQLIYETDDTACYDLKIPDGVESFEGMYYIQKTDELWIDGKKVAVDVIAKDPAAYGFEAMNTYVIENGEKYIYWAKNVNGADARNQINQMPQTLQRPPRLNSSSVHGTLSMGSSSDGAEGSYLIAKPVSYDRYADSPKAAVRMIAGDVASLAGDYFLSGLPKWGSDTKDFIERMKYAQGDPDLTKMLKTQYGAQLADHTLMLCLGLSGGIVGAAFGPLGTVAFGFVVPSFIRLLTYGPALDDQTNRMGYWTALHNPNYPNTEAFKLFMVK